MFKIRVVSTRQPLTHFQYPTYLKTELPHNTTPAGQEHTNKQSSRAFCILDYTAPLLDIYSNTLHAIGMSGGHNLYVELLN